METAKRIIFLLILAILIISPVQSEEKQSAQISNTRTANCLVKVTCDPAILPLNLETIDYLLQSSGVGGKAQRDVLGISPDQYEDLFIVEYVQLFSSENPGRISQQLRTGRPSGFVEGMDEYEYAMMMEAEMEKRRPMSRQSATSSRGSRSSSSSTRKIPSTDRTTAATPDLPPDEQIYLFRLNVGLPDEVKPMAMEFIHALVDNLHQSLREAHNVYSNNLEALLNDAESRRDRARLRLAEVMDQVKALGPPPEIKQNPADAAVYEQLETIVDLSMLDSSTSFAEAIEILANSVDPPLQIQPNWKDLLENAEVEQTTPAGMDPLTGVKLRKALEILIAGISSQFAELGYVVDEGVIIISTIDALPNNMVPCVYEIPALAYSPGSAKDLIDTIQNTIDPESWVELGLAGEGTITPYPRQRPRKLTILQTYENHQKIWEFLQNITIDIPAGIPSDVPVEMLQSEKSNLLREKQNLEMELARLQGRMPAIDEQIMRIKMEIEEKIRNDQVSEELRKILDMQVKYVEGVKKLVDNRAVSPAELTDAEEKIARTKIELARRREQIGSAAGADQLAKFSNELAMQAIDMAEKKAMLEIVSNQLNRTEQQLTAGDISDPQISRIRMATQTLDIAERRVNELNTRLINLQLPTVSVLGAK